jgi:Skp family chaperone for outer membrane proteins
VTRILFALSVLALGWVSSAAAEESHKDGVINLQAAMASTKDGQKAASELQTRFGPKKLEFEKRQTAIAGLQDQLNRGVNTLSEEARQNLVRDIDQKTRSLNRDTEDARVELDQEQETHEPIGWPDYGRSRKICQRPRLHDDPRRRLSPNAGAVPSGFDRHH